MNHPSTIHDMLRASEFRMLIVKVRINMFCSAAKLSLMIDTSHNPGGDTVFIDCLHVSPSGLPESTAEGLDKTHQESTQT